MINTDPCIYGLIEEVYTMEEQRRLSYGVAAYDASEGTIAVLASVRDVTSDKQKISELINQCNQAQLSPMHLADVVDDYIISPSDVGGK